jgi:peptidoglycan hydrolase-like protein with peptidoglycan-binding domain
VTTHAPQEQIRSGAAGANTRPTRWRRSRRAKAVSGVIAVVIIVAGVVIGITNPFGGAAASGGGVAGNASATSITHVRQGSLSAQILGVGALGYAAQPDGSPYVAVGQATGTITGLPSIGQVIRQGQPLFWVNNSPVVLLNGGTPVSRALSTGASGPDVRELNADLRVMGYLTRPALHHSAGYFGPATAAAVARLQGVLGEARTGSLALGQAVFLPAPLRVAKRSAVLGGNIHPGATVLEATSTTREVRVSIDATQQSSLRVGDPVLITLPNYQDTSGAVVSIGTVAKGSGSSIPTIPVGIMLKHPGVAGRVDQAPVRVQITTAGVNNALIVPVTALLPRAGGGYVVETVNAAEVHHLVPVTLGLFDDADGLVQVFSRSLAAGQAIVVAAA